jgi:hypothetical protein
MLFKPAWRIALLLLIPTLPVFGARFGVRSAQYQRMAQPAKDVFENPSRRFRQPRGIFWGEICWSLS